MINKIVKLKDIKIGKKYYHVVLGHIHSLTVNKIEPTTIHVIFGVDTWKILLSEFGVSNGTEFKHNPLVGLFTTEKGAKKWVSTKKYKNDMKLYKGKYSVTIY